MLERILRHIDRIYDLGLSVRISDYLISSEACAELGADTDCSSVLVRQGEDDEEIGLGVYIDAGKLGRLERLNLDSDVSSENLAVLCDAIEEVSHFAYLLFCASLEKAVTQLELELQAEVDKFITLTLLLAAGNRGRVPLNLHERLFGDVRLRSGMDPGQRERYLAASSLAARYCSRVVQTHLARGRLTPLLPELREFYRLSHTGKIGRIHNVVYAA